MRSALFCNLASAFCLLASPSSTRVRLRVSGLRLPLFAHVYAVAAKGPSMRALDKLGATLRLSRPSRPLAGSACSFRSAVQKRLSNERLAPSVSLLILPGAALNIGTATG